MKCDRIVNIFRNEIAASVNRDRNFFPQLIVQPLLGRSWRSRPRRRLLSEETQDDDDGDDDANENNGLLFASTSSHHISSSRSQKKKRGVKKKKTSLKRCFFPTLIRGKFCKSCQSVR